MSARAVASFAALGDPVRIAIVDRLVGGDATVGELAGLFTITTQAVSQQISTLERAGVVTRHREGRTRRVHLEVTSLQEVARWMEARRLRLEQRYQRLDDVLTGVLAAELPPPTATRSAPPASRKDRS
ncbi:MAG: metalloregulator ArsR/SmtB family transcription factor [Mycobacteriaceae bacterium]